jgi:hypothetical protein
LSQLSKIYSFYLKPIPLKIHSILALCFFLPFASWGQFSTAADQLEFTNPAYHLDAKIHGDGYQASSLNFNTAYFGWNKLVINDFQNYLRFQQSMGSWKIGLNASHTRLWDVQNGSNLGLTIAKDIALNRNWSIRPAIGLNYSRYRLGSPVIEFITDKYQLVYLDLGIQLRYKNWQFFSGVNSIYSSKAYVMTGGIEPVYLTNIASYHVGLQKSFQIDSLQTIATSLFYEQQQGFHYFNASVNYERKAQSYVLGLSVNQLSLGFGQQLAKAHRVMLSFNVNQPSLLNNSIIRCGVQLNYKWQLMHKPSVLKFTGTPSF